MRMAEKHVERGFGFQGTVRATPLTHRSSLRGRYGPLVCHFLRHLSLDANSSLTWIRTLTQLPPCESQEEQNAKIALKNEGFRETPGGRPSASRRGSGGLSRMGSYTTPLRDCTIF
jgi:hypothetical protein